MRYQIRNVDAYRMQIENTKYELYLSKYLLFTIMLFLHPSKYNGKRIDRNKQLFEFACHLGKYFRAIRFCLCRSFISNRSTSSVSCYVNHRAPVPHRSFTRESPLFSIASKCDNLPSRKRNLTALRRIRN